MMRDELIRIAERAVTLDERLSGSLECIEDPSERTAVRIQNWKQSAAFQNDRQFEERLRLDGIDIPTLQRITGHVRFSEEQDLPPWVPTLERLIECAGFEPVHSETKLPFAELFLPFVRFARKRLQEVAGSSLQLLTNGAIETLEQTLLRKISRICSRPLALELNIARVLGTLHGSTPRERYYYFIREKIASPAGFLSFFTDYPVAARLVAVQVDQWIDATAEFVSRLKDDLPDLQNHFGGDPGVVVAILDHLSDAHCEGRTTKKITFDSGLTLIYKPKNLAADLAFQDLLRWINAGRKLLPLKTFSILNRETHGWVEFLNPQSCTSPEQVDNYFYRAGMLLCLLHILGGTDCHSENLLACGEHPVLVDLEAVLEIRLQHHSNKIKTADDLAQDIARMSPQHTGMLPRWVFAEAGVAGADFSGLLGGSAQKFPFRVPQWEDAETDHMNLELKFITQESSPSRPMLQEREVPVSVYPMQIERGFEGMYLYLMDSKETVMRSGLLEKLLMAEIRYINRATTEYGLILQKSLNPRFLKDGIDRSIHLDLLCRKVFLNDLEDVWSFVKAERTALERLDIPYFTSIPSENFIRTDRYIPLPEPQTISGKELLHQRLSSMTTESMKKQILFLRACIAMRSGPRLPAPFHSATEMNENFQDSDLVNSAVEIGEQLRQWAIASNDGSVSWIGAEFFPDSKQFSIAPAQDAFYSGKCGIAFFLAALDRFVPDRGLGELSLAAIKTMRHRLLGSKGEIYAKSLELGAMSGLSSVIWSFVSIGKLLRDDTLIRDAASISRYLTPDLIAKDRRLDVISGSAGAILALLALNRSCQDYDFLVRAECCADHLLDQSHLDSEGIRFWETVRGERLTGLSHGAAGYAYALCRLFEATGNEKYRDAAQQAILYERSVYSPSHKNWPDFRNADVEELRFMTGWCHGAPGIALSRIGCLPHIDGTEVQDEIDTALKTTVAAGIQSLDDTCCGNFSRIETLLIASKHLGRPDLKAIARRQANALLELSKKNGAFRLEPDVHDGMVNPGFMKGIAGVGFGLLHLVNPDLPSPHFM